MKGHRSMLGVLLVVLGGLALAALWMRGQENPPPVSSFLGAFVPLCCMALVAFFTPSASPSK